MSPALHVVTGAFGYTGRYIAERLVKAGATVRTLTHSPGRANPFGGRIDVHPFSFDDPARLVESLRGTAVLYNTYWIRFNHRRFKQAPAVTNTLKLFDAARRAGVGKVVHVSITNPSLDSPLEYFRGKAVLERALVESVLPHAILRPAVLFGREDILINNIAYLLRRVPFFAVFGRGDYSLQPIHVDDFAELAVQAGGADGNLVIDAIGPQTFTFRDLVRQIGDIIGRPRPIISAPPTFAYAVGALAGKLVGDVIITRPEIEGLMAGLLCTDSPPAGRTKLTDWARRHHQTLGIRYASELARRVNREAAYDRL